VSKETTCNVFMENEETCLSAIRAIVVDVMTHLGADVHDFRLRDKLIVSASRYMKKHEARLSTLTAERDELARKLGEAERLLQSSTSQRCEVDGYWFHATKIAEHRADAAEAKIAELEAQHKDMRSRNKWLRDRWDLMPDDLRKRERYAVLERLDQLQAKLATIRSLARDALLAEQFPLTGDAPAVTALAAIAEIVKE
jgi:DNA repair exonuclease SbcCD ATPase subunit